MRLDSDLLLFLLVFGSLIVILMLAAWIIAISKLIEIARTKGIRDTGILWFIGILASPIVLGLYVIALPGKQSVVTIAQSLQPDELPDL